MKKFAIFTAVATICLFAFGCNGSSSGSNSEVEPNNAPLPGHAQVCSLPISGLTGSVAYPGDEDDYFQIQLTAGQVVHVTMSFTNTAADLDVYLYDSAQNIVDGSDSTTNMTESFSYIVPVSGTYYVNVWAYSGTSAYTLVVTVS